MADTKTTTTKRRRARTEEGHYKADDPSTPDVNEAYVQEEEPVEAEKPAAPARKTTAKASGPVWYESREKEPRMYPVAGIDCIRNFSNGHIEWEVPAEDVERFEANHFFVRGRIRRKG
jgi:hypothetical protein